MPMEGPFIFFDLGQTLVDEWRFIDYLDHKLLDLLNGFGAKIDIRNFSGPNWVINTPLFFVSKLI